MVQHKPRIILASQSRARQTMLKNAGVDFDVIPSGIDEAAFKTENHTPENLASLLATEKARAVSKKQSQALVIGSDQILMFDNRVLSKAHSKKQALEKLKMLRARTHSLISAVSVVQNGKLLWTHTDQADITMRDFDDNFLDLYIEKAGAALIRSVGAYELESSGIWLFEEIKGDYFTILGLPLLPLLHYLRTQGIRL